MEIICRFVIGKHLTAPAQDCQHAGSQVLHLHKVDSSFIIIIIIVLHAAAQIPADEPFFKTGSFGSII